MTAHQIVARTSPKEITQCVFSFAVFHFAPCLSTNTQSCVKKQQVGFHIEVEFPLMPTQNSAVYDEPARTRSPETFPTEPGKTDEDENTNSTYICIYTHLFGLSLSRSLSIILSINMYVM